MSWSLLFSLGLGGCGEEEDSLDAARFPLIPRPVELEPGRGEYRLGDATVIAVSPSDREELQAVVERWASGLRSASGFPLPLMGPEEAPGRDVIRISLEAGTDSGTGSRPAATPAGHGLPGTEAEGYELDVNRQGVRLRASGEPGIYYGLNALNQLIPALAGSESWTIPAVEIDDQPRFAYRGMHLDVGRHFFPVSFVKRYLDLLAQYRMNVFHWHLTEDQGWRLEIEGYPRLTEVGSCRAETILEKNFDPYVGDGVPHCGFYTVQEAREIVEYARERFITVIPEIEMPGHSVAALAAYPELGCTPGPFQVFTRWGVTRDIYCPKEETFAFLEDVLEQVMEIFPSPYIHIGGDEAPKARWEESPVAQEVMRREGLEDEEELQSWFIRRIEAFLNGHGRRLIGWDEILQGGLAPDATVMSWRGEDGGIQAAREGHDVIMTPNARVYLDHYQGDTIQEPLAIGGFTPLEEVYAYEPVPASLTGEEARHVLGAQGNLWTEYISTAEHVEYMILPRMLALSEVVWSPEASRNWDSFLDRLPPHLGRLSSRGVNYRIPDVRGLEEDRMVLGDSVVLELSAPVQGGVIVFGLNQGPPGPGATRYQGPLVLPLNESGVDGSGVEVTARVVLPDGRVGPYRSARFTRTHLAAPVGLPLVGRRQGLAAEGFAGRFRSVASLSGGTPLDLGETPGRRPVTVPRVTLPPQVSETSFGLRLEGFLRVPRKGIYRFFLSSDDGSLLTIAGRVVADNDGPHGMSSASGEVALHRGWHPIQVLYFQSGGARGLRLEVSGPGLPRQEVPADWFAHLPQDVQGSR